MCYTYIHMYGGSQWCSWLRHCATSQKFAGSIPDDVVGIFHWHNPSGLTVALGLTRTVTEMRTRDVSWGVKAAGVWGWQLYHLHVPVVSESGSLKLLEPSGPKIGLHKDCFTFYTYIHARIHVYIHMYVHTYIHTYVLCTCVHTYVCTYLHT